MKIEFSRHFERCYRKLPPPIQQKADEQIGRIIQRSNHPSLRMKKLVGTSEIWEVSVTMNYRITFQFTGNHIIFRKIGTHDILQNP